jgi:hypothetical protein
VAEYLPRMLKVLGLVPGTIKKKKKKKKKERKKKRKRDFSYLGGRNSIRVEELT